MATLRTPSRRQALGLIATSLAASCTPGPASAQSPQPTTLAAHRASRPVVVAFDVFETVVSLEPVRARIQDIGLAPESLPLIFARMLRDGFALEAMGNFVPFRELAAATIRVELLDRELPADDAKIAHVLEAFATLPLHPDSRAGFERLHAAGIRIVTITNGSAENATKLLRHVGLESFVERKLSVDDVRHWKPHRDVYLHVARATGVQPSQVALIAAHPWDIAGARRARLTTGFVARRGAHYPAVMDPPHVQGATLGEVADRLLSLGPA